MIEIIKGNLFDANVNALAHGCNCVGQMGKGIALEFKKRWPAMYEEYVRRCRSRVFLLGTVMIWKERTTIFNLATQIAPRHQADLFSVRQTLTLTRQYMDNMGLSTLAMPKIGCGRKWEQVEPIVQEVFIDWPGTVSVYYLEGK